MYISRRTNTSSYAYLWVMYRHTYNHMIQQLLHSSSSFRLRSQREGYGGIRRHRAMHGPGSCSRLSRWIDNGFLRTPFPDGDGMVSCPSNMPATVSVCSLFLLLLILFVFQDRDGMVGNEATYLQLRVYIIFLLNRPLFQETYFDHSCRRPLLFFSVRSSIQKCFVTLLFLLIIPFLGSFITIKKIFIFIPRIQQRFLNAYQEEVFFS